LCHSNDDDVADQAKHHLDAAVLGTAMALMTPKMPDPALHSSDLSPGPFENGNGRSGRIGSLSGRWQEITARGVRSGN
jgi:hypothetical protein